MEEDQKKKLLEVKTPTFPQFMKAFLSVEENRISLYRNMNTELKNDAKSVLLFAGATFIVTGITDVANHQFAAMSEKPLDKDWNQVVHKQYEIGGFALAFSLVFFGVAAGLKNVVKKHEAAKQVQPPKP